MRMSMRIPGMMQAMLTFVKLATSVLRSASYSLGSMMRVSEFCMLEKKVESTVPMRST